MTKERLRLTARFSLRGLLLLTTVFAICTGWLVRRNMQRNAVLDEVRRLGGSVQVDESIGFVLFANERVIGIRLPHETAASFEASSLTVFPHLKFYGENDIPSAIPGKYYSTVQLKVTREFLETVDRHNQQRKLR